MAFYVEIINSNNPDEFILQLGPYTERQAEQVAASATPCLRKAEVTRIVEDNTVEDGN